VYWDGRDDDGARLPSFGHYHVRVLAHNVRYTWEGVIGNTSRDTTGAHIHRAFGPIAGMAIDAAGDGFYVVGYNEQQHGLHRFQTSDVQRQTALAHDDYRRVFSYVATDGEIAYFANVGLCVQKGSDWREPSTFVVGLRVSDGQQYAFGTGRVDMPGGHWGNRWDSVIDFDRDDFDVDGQFRSAASGIAVQQHGGALFVAHKLLNELRVFDKRTGQLLSRVPVVAPQALAIAPDDSLWLVSGTSPQPVLMHFKQTPKGWSTGARVIKGLVKPVALGISPVTGALVVADAGSEQLRAFDSSGKILWTYGSVGSYNDGSPSVDYQRLWLSAGATYIAFQADGSFWVGDPGNARNLHLSADHRKVLEQIQYLPHSYHVAVDYGNPRRVFDRFLEFAVDYTRPLRESWQLVRNWEAGLDGSFKGDLDGLYTVVTLSNARTYGVAPRFSAKQRWSEVVELTRNGLRPTGIRLGYGLKLYPDGSLRQPVVQFRTLQIMSQRLSGFDPAGNPIWSAATSIATAGPLAAQDPYYHDVPLVAGVNEASAPITDGGIVVSFNPGNSTGFHLGGIRLGAQGWQWRASPSGSWALDSAGNVLSRDGTYELGRGVQYPGNVAVAAGAEIIYGYHGEAWNGGEADQWMHFHEDGLFIGQFGQPAYPAANREEARPETAGNAFSPQLVNFDGTLYLWHNDESVHGGVHRWRIDGLKEMQELEVPIAP
jgi:hypothetical protein